MILHHYSMWKSPRNGNVGVSLANKKPICNNSVQQQRQMTDGLFLLHYKQTIALPLTIHSSFHLCLFQSGPKHPHSSPETVNKMYYQVNIVFNGPGCGGLFGRFGITALYKHDRRRRRRRRCLSSHIISPQFLNLKRYRFF